MFNKPEKVKSRISNNIFDPKTETGGNLVNKKNFDFEKFEIGNNNLNSEQNLPLTNKINEPFQYFSNNQHTSPQLINNNYFTKEHSFRKSPSFSKKDKYYSPSTYSNNNFKFNHPNEMENVNMIPQSQVGGSIMKNPSFESHNEIYNHMKDKVSKYFNQSNDEIFQSHKDYSANDEKNQFNYHPQYFNNNSPIIEQSNLMESQDIKSNSKNTEAQMLKKLNDVSKRQLFGNNSQPTNDLIKSSSQFEQTTSKKLNKHSNFNSSTVTDSKFNIGHKTNILKSSISTQVKKLDPSNQKIIFEKNANSNDNKLSLSDNNQQNNTNGNLNYSEFEKKKQQTTNYSKTNSSIITSSNITFKKEILTNIQELSHANSNKSKNNNTSQFTFQNSSKEFKNLFPDEKKNENNFTKSIKFPEKDKTKILDQDQNSKQIPLFHSMGDNILEKRDNITFFNSENLEKKYVTKFEKVSSNFFEDDNFDQKLKSIDSENDLCKIKSIPNNNTQFELENKNKNDNSEINFNSLIQNNQHRIKEFKGLGGFCDSFKG